MSASDDRNYAEELTRKLISRFPDAIDDVAFIDAALRDLFGSEKLGPERFLLLSAAKAGVPRMIREGRDPPLDFGPSPQDAKWAVGAWESACRLSPPDPIPVQPVSITAPPHPIAVQPDPISEPRPRVATRGILIALALLLLAGFGTLRFLWPHNNRSVRVCSTSITQHLATHMVRAYTESDGAVESAFRFLPPSGAGSQSACDVRFSVRLLSPADEHIVDPDGTIGYDAIVAVVNPSFITRGQISRDHVRAVYAGTISNWRQLGESPAAIFPKLPDGTTEEAQLLAKTLLSGVTFAPNVVKRFPSSLDVADAVTSPNGRYSIGLVAFSQRNGAKVLSLGDWIQPNALTIANHSYALSVAIVITSDSFLDQDAANFVMYARSEKAQQAIFDSGLVTKKGTSL